MNSLSIKLKNNLVRQKDKMLEWINYKFQRKLVVGIVFIVIYATNSLHHQMAWFVADFRLSSRAISSARPTFRTTLSLDQSDSFVTEKVDGKKRGNLDKVSKPGTSSFGSKHAAFKVIKRIDHPQKKYNTSAKRNVARSDQSNNVLHSVANTVHIHAHMKDLRNKLSEGKVEAGLNLNLKSRSKKQHSTLILSEKQSAGSSTYSKNVKQKVAVSKPKHAGRGANSADSDKFLEKPKPVSKRPIAVYTPPNETFLLTACTMVKNEAPYIVEWIEFNRMQGVDRIVIYDHASLDNVAWLLDFYKQRAPEFRLHLLESFEEKSKYQNLQQMNFQHCLETFGNSTEWMVNVDVDEYLYSPAFGTLASMLRNLSAIERKRGLHFSGMTSVNLNFGSSGQEHRFENKLVRGADGRVTYRNPCGLQLITDHILRGPAANIFGESEEYQDMVRGLWICGLKGRFPPCRHNPGKTIFRPPDIAEAGIHVPERARRRGDSLYFNPPLLVGNHYYYRSRADVMLKAAQWRAGSGLPEHIRNYNLTDSLLWGRTEDRRLRDRWGPELQRRMSALVTTGGSGKCLHGVGRGAT